MPNFDELIDVDSLSVPTSEVDIELPIAQENDDDLDFLEKAEESDETSIFNQENQTEEQKGFLNRLLESKGYNPKEIKISNEYGEEETVSFDDLTDEEKYQILSMPDVELSNDEIDVINFLRSNNTTLQQVIEARERLAVQNAFRNYGQTFIVDQATDEQLMMAELKSKYPNFTQEELEQELEKEIDSPTFDKKVSILREQYKKLEEEDKLEEQNRFEQEREANYQQTYHALLNVAQATDDLAGIELEDSDKEDVLRFLLERDVNGQSEFYKLLNNPKTLFDVAWFALKGGEAMNMIHQYYRKEIETARKANRQESPNSTVRVRQKSANNSSEDKYGLADYFNNK